MERKTDLSGFVYLVKPKNLPCKIGRTQDVERRLHGLKTGFPFGIEVLHAITAFDRFRLERQLHLRFAAKRLDGEWFDLSEEEIAWVQQGADESFFNHLPVNPARPVEGVRPRAIGVDPENDDDLTTAGAARRLNVNGSRIRQFVLDGRLTRKKFGRDLVLSRAEVEALALRLAEEAPRKRGPKPKVLAGAGRRG